MSRAFSFTRLPRRELISEPRSPPGRLHNEHLAVKLDAEGGVHHVGIRAKEVEARKEEVDKRREQDEEQQLPFPHEIGKAFGDIAEDVFLFLRLLLRARNGHEKHFGYGGQKERERVEEQCPAHADPPHEQHTGHRPRDFYDLSPAVADGIIHADAFTVDHLTDDGAIRRRVEGVHNGKQSVRCDDDLRHARRGDEEAHRKAYGRGKNVRDDEDLFPAAAVGLRAADKVEYDLYDRLRALVKRQHPRRVSESADNAHAVRVIKNDVAELGRPLSKPEQRLVLSLFSHISPQPSSTQPSFSSE